MPTDPDYASDATSLGEALKRFEAEGFTGQFSAMEGGVVVCYGCHEKAHASEIELTALIRTEGASDPDDMTAVGAVTCPQCGQKGTLVVHFGALAPPEHDDVLRALEDHRVDSGTTATSG